MPVRITRNFWQNLSNVREPLYSRYDLGIDTFPWSPRELIDLWIWDTYDMVSQGLSQHDLDYDIDAMCFGDLLGDNKVRLSIYQEVNSSYCHITVGASRMWRGFVFHEDCFELDSMHDGERLVDMTIGETVVRWLEEMGLTYGYTG